jgi:hypothetical protein
LAQWIDKDFIQEANKNSNHATDTEQYPKANYSNHTIDPEQFAKANSRQILPDTDTTKAESPVEFSLSCI